MDNPCLTGELNIAVTPSSVLSLGEQIGSMLGGGTAGIASDGDHRLYVLKNALISGIAACGCRVYDLERGTLPVLRHTLKQLKLDFGIYLSISGDTVSITLTDKNGCDLSESGIKKLSKSFINYCESGDVPPLTKVKSIPLYYTAYLKSQIPPQKKACSVICKNSYINDIISTLFTDDSKKDFFIIKTDDSGEPSEYYTSSGVPLSDEQMTAAFCLFILKYGYASKFVAPISRSCILEDIALKYNGRIIRCKTDKSDIMQTLVSNGLDTQFNIMFDACYSMLFLCRCLQKENKNLKQLVDSLPEFHMYEKEVECGLAQKNHIIKALTETGDNRASDIKNGVKIKNKDSTILIIPHSEKPACRIIVEGKSEEYAKELTDIYVKKVQKIIDGENKSIQE